jgi:hypothetical protein
MAKEARFEVRVSETQKARIVKAATGKKSVAAFLLSSAECRMKWSGVIRAIEQAEDRGFKKSTIAAAVIKTLAQI